MILKEVVMTPQKLDEQVSILHYWWMLEMFSPQKLPKRTPLSTRPVDERVVSWKPADPLPWEALAPPKPWKGRPRVWQHSVYLGLYDLEVTYERLQRVFGVDTNAYDERPPGKSACAAFMVNSQGRYMPTTSVLSSALWAVAKIEQAGPRRVVVLDGFPQAAAGFSDAVDDYEGKRREAAGEDRPPAQDACSMQEILSIAHRWANVTGVPGLATSLFLIKSRAILASEETVPDNDFLNSFYLDGLAAVRADIASTRSVGAALDAYLTPDRTIDVRAQVDVIASPHAVDAGVVIDRLPAGRWPSEPKHGLALSQQFAVNQAINELAPTHGLMGVNGPPGTGKTTMLRDILAGNVVARASLLAKLKRPNDAFTGVVHEWTDKDGWRRTVPKLRPELIGFEMVVASANNRAVENVTVEIPACEAIAGQWRGGADYFADIATAVMGGKSEGGDGASVRAWGLVAAKLGNKGNRNKFRSEFWYDKASRRGAVSVPRMQTRLKQWSGIAFSPKDWAQACAVFKSAEQRVEALVGSRRQAQERLRSLPGLARRVECYEAQMRHLDEGLRAARCEQQESAGREAVAAEILGNVVERHNRQVEIKPNFIEAILSLGRALHDWRASLAPITADLHAAEQRHLEAVLHARQLADSVAHRTRELDSVRAKLEQQKMELANLRSACEADREHYGSSYPGEAWSGDQRELHAPWLDAELDTARSELFFAALKLHQDFFAHTAHTMQNGLRAAMDVIAGVCPSRLEAEKQQAAWELFFLVVPLVSTTFASVDRMFGKLGRESVGWLLIDEAGQASPQWAAGAIWRAKRVVAVGDPLQLQPIVTIPQKAQRDLAQGFGVSSTWLAPQASVQTLADRISRYGTTLYQGGQDVWVSAPLKVHRRCDDPMFTLCNRIAYNEIMINGVHRSSDDDLFDSARGPLIAASQWIDEPAKTPGTHLQRNQIARLERLIRYLQKMGIPATEIIAISPFRAVANALGRLEAKYPGLSAGTIHTSQGREAAVVVFVLGGDPEKPGAKAWAASTVNLVNVAASRAKRRLYVIGDHKKWAEHNYFSQLAAALAPPPPAGGDDQLSGRGRAG